MSAQEPATRTQGDVRRDQLPVNGLCLMTSLILKTAQGGTIWEAPLQRKEGCAPRKIQVDYCRPEDDVPTRV